MAELAYMTRAGWAGSPPDLAAGSERVHAWLAGRRHLVAVPRIATGQRERTADTEAIRWISPPGARIDVREISCLTHDLPHDGTDVPILFVHPEPKGDEETVRQLTASGQVRSAFVLVWSEMDLVRLWLQAVGATDLSGDTPPLSPDPVMMSAARDVASFEYDGLGTGRGKDATIQAIRVLSAEGYPLDPELWARALLRAGASLQSAKLAADYVRGIASGHNYRTKPRFREDIAAHWHRAAKGDEGNLDTAKRRRLAGSRRRGAQSALTGSVERSSLPIS